MNIKVIARKVPLNRVSRIPVPSVTIWQSIFPCIPRNREKNSSRERRASVDERHTFASRTTRVSR